MANHVFADEWRVAADLEIVWTVLRRLEEWPDWWPSVRSLTRRYWGASSWMSCWNISTPGPTRSSKPCPIRSGLRGVYNVGGGPHFGSGLTIDRAAELHADGSSAR